MKIINKMPDVVFETICEAGVDLINQSLIPLLNKKDINLSEAANVMAVTVAGVLKASNISIEEFITAVEAISPMWTNETKGNERGVVFNFNAVKPDLHSNGSVDTSKSN
jgi:hypothetical protein